jgi:hypothetical protein
MSQTYTPFNKTYNNLYTKEECPKCHSVFIVGFDKSNSRCCPSCGHVFFLDKEKKHRSRCSIYSNRHNGSNNIHYQDGCPAIMSDGRFVTYYTPTNELTSIMMKINDIHDPNEFRRFMQKNADFIINMERDYILKKNICSPTIGCSQGWNDLWSKRILTKI